MTNNEESENPILKALPVITMVIASLITLSNFVDKEIVNLNIWVVLSCLFAFWVYSIYSVLPRKTKLKKRPQSKMKPTWLRYLPVVVIPILTIVILLFRFIETKDCIDNYIPTIGVANFEELNQSQDFSTELIAALKKKAYMRKSELSIKYISSFFDLKEQDNVIFEKLRESAHRNCISQGLIIYGRWKDKGKYPLFHGYFFIQDNEDFKRVSHHPIPVLKSLKYDIIIPERFQFRMPIYVDSIANAALGILKFYEGSYVEARKLLQSNEISFGKPTFYFAKMENYSISGQLDNGSSDDGLRAIFEFYLATIDVIEGNISNAKIRYLRSYHLNATNEAAFRNYKYLESLKRGDKVVIKRNDTTLRIISPKKSKENDTVTIKKQKKPIIDLYRKTIKLDTQDSQSAPIIVEKQDKRIETGEASITALKTEVALVDKYSSTTFSKKSFVKVNVFTENEKFGIWDKDHQVLTERLYDKIYAPGREGFVRVLGDGKVGFITALGKPVGLLKFDGAHDFQEGMAAVRISGKWGFINSKGEEVIPCQYEIIISDFVRETAVVSNGGKKALRIDKRGGVVRTERLKVR